MKLISLSVLALSALVAHARYVETNEPNHVVLGDEDSQLYLIELAPGITKWVSEEQKWELKRNGKKFMDITDNQDLASYRISTAKKDKKFPPKPALQDKVKPLLANLSTVGMEDHLETFTAFHTRYYKSDYGKESSNWLLKTVGDMIKDAGADKYGVYVKPFKHPWGQNSIIATIPGKSNATAVVGAHQDSINLLWPAVLSAPGADDDGSGTVTIMEAFRVLLTYEDLIKGNAENTLEFHWYSAEEGGLLGSQAIFQEYAMTGRDVKAMLQQDMTGFIQKTLDAGLTERVGVITDYVDPELTAFIKTIVTEYCDIPYVETQCGYACSDHASASKAGYPSAFVIESEFKYSDNRIHSSYDTIEYLSFPHMLQHAKLTLGLAFELAYASL